MEKNIEEMETKDFLNEVLDIKSSEVKREITKKLEEIETTSKKINMLKNIVADKNLTIVLINQNIARLQTKADTLKNEITEDAKEIEKPEI